MSDDKHILNVTVNCPFVGMSSEDYEKVMELAVEIGTLLKNRMDKNRERVKIEIKI